MLMYNNWNQKAWESTLYRIDLSNLTENTLVLPWSHMHGYITDSEIYKLTYSDFTCSHPDIVTQKQAVRIDRTHIIYV